MIARMTAAYREYRPCPALAPFVECYWSRASGPHIVPQPRHAVLPDGCMDVVFSFGEGWTGSDSNDVSRRAGFRGGAVVGTMTAPLIVAPGPREDFFGVRFRPGMAPALLQVSASEFTDSAASLFDVWGREGTRLEQRVADARSTTLRTAAMEAMLLRRLCTAARPDPCVRAALHLIHHGSGRVTVRETCKFAGVSRQHLARRFAEHVGVSPKMFARITRFRSLLACLSAGSPVHWSDAAAQAGYYDQSHLIADFRQFAGNTPERFLAGPAA